MKLYHLDRTGHLSDNQKTSCSDINIQNVLHMKNSSLFAPTLEDVFSSSLSNHGINYCIHPILESGNILEWIYEAIRLRSFNHRPSRFQSLFAFLDIVDAKNFMRHPDNKKSYPNAKLWEIEGTPLFIGDMKLLHNHRQSGLITIQNAYNYWSGILTDNPIREVLLEGFTVIQQIDT